MSAAPINRAWDVIGVAQKGRAGEFRVAPSDVLCGSSAALFALDELGNRHLLVPLVDIEQKIADKRSGGVHLRTFVLEDGATRKAYLDIACRKQHVNEVFALLVGEMLDRLRVDCREPLRTCRGVLSRWRDLLDREHGQFLTMEALIGLYGELCALREIVARNPVALAAWTGPLGTPNDFTAGSLALEVKTTLGPGWNVMIHGLSQLDVVFGSSLWLSVYQVHRDDALGESVPDVVDDLIARGADRAVLLARLGRVNYLLDDREQYTNVKLRRSALRMWTVDSNFPRIVGSSFGPQGPPRAVRSVDYILDVDAAGEDLSSDEIVAVYDRLSGRGDL